MDREPTTLPGQTWEFFSACIHYLGKSTLTALFQRGERQIERWSADPATSGSQRNPIDRYEMLLQALMDKGQAGTARSAVARQAHIVGCELADKQMPVPDKTSIELEIIDDLSAKNEYDTVLLDSGSTQEQCRTAMETFIREVKENYVKKCQDRGWTP
jgi:hypothetical protein